MDTERLNQTFRVGNRIRLYDIYLPDNWDKKSVVIYLHGGGGNPTIHRRQSRIIEAADKYGFAAVGLHGTGPLGMLTWNAGNCCGYAHDNQVDDVGFINAFIDFLIRQGYVAEGRIFLMGFSNGAAMAYRCLQHPGHKIAAICAISSTAQVPLVHWTRPVPVCHIHGMLDTHAPWYGGVGVDAVSKVEHQPVIKVAAEVGKNNSATGSPQFAGGPDALHIIWGGKQTSYLTLLPGGGHTYPGGVDVRDGKDGPVSAFDATQAAWNFFTEWVR
jgi:polyhydroxybutyrate depolymerase